MHIAGGVARKSYDVLHVNVEIPSTCFQTTNQNQKRCICILYIHLPSDLIPQKVE